MKAKLYEKKSNIFICLILFLTAMAFLPVTGTYALAADTAPASSHDPVIVLESVDAAVSGALQVRGWAYDPDNTARALTVSFYTVSSGGMRSPAGSLTADRLRQDIDRQYHCGSYHGFEGTLNISAKGTFTVQAEAVNIGQGTNTVSVSPSVTAGKDTVPPTLSGLTVSQISERGYTVSVNVSDNVGVAYVAMPSWTGAYSNDVPWTMAEAVGNRWSHTVRRYGESGYWQTEIHAYDAAGNQAPLINILIYPVTVYLEPNGGSCDTDSLSLFNVSSLTGYTNRTYMTTFGTLPEAVRKGYIFRGWFTDPNGGEEFTADRQITLTEDLVLYAHWDQIETQAPVITDVSVSELSTRGYTVTVQATDNIGVTRVLMPSWVGAYHEGVEWPEAFRNEDGSWSLYIPRQGETGIWHTEIYAYDAAGNQSPLASVYLRYLTVVFDPAGGTCSPLSKSVFQVFYLIDYANQTYLATYGELPTPVYGSRTFDGWYTDTGTPVTADSPVRTDQNHTLYAHWSSGALPTPTPRVTAAPGTTPVPDDGSPRILVGSAAARPGGTVEIPVAVQNNPGVLSMLLRVNYDASALTLRGVDDGGILGQSESAGNSDFSSMPYILSWSNDTSRSNRTGNGTIATLIFAVSANAAQQTYPIQVSYDNTRHEIINADLQPVSFAVTNGSVRVSRTRPGDVNADGAVTPLDRIYLARYLAGWNGYTSAEVDLSAADVNSDGTVTALDRVILARHLAGWNGYDTLPYGTARTASLQDAGQSDTAQYAADADAVQQNTVLADADALQQNKPTDAVQQNALSDAVIQDADAAPMILADNLVTLSQGEEKTVSVRLENAPGLAALSITASWPDELVLTDMQDCGRFADTTHNPDGLSPLRLQWGNDTVRNPAAVSGEIIRLTFRLSDNAPAGSYSVTLECTDAYDADLQSVPFAVVYDNGPSETYGTIGTIRQTPNAFQAEISCGISGAKAFFAAYDINGKLLDVETQPVPQGNNTFTFFRNVSCHTVRIFVLDSKLKPLITASASDPFPAA